MNISVQFEDTDVYNVLNDMISHPNKEEYLKLLVPIICESHKGSDWFFRLHMGKKLPEIITKGTLCYIQVDELNYQANKANIKNSNLCNKEGDIICKVLEFRGYHAYSTYSISYTNVNDDDTQNESTVIVNQDVLRPIEEF